MKKFIIPLVTAAVMVSIMFAGCVPGAAPAPPVTPPVTPPPAPPGLWPTPEDTAAALAVEAANGLVLNPWGENFAVKPDGTPYWFHHINVWMQNEVSMFGEEITRSIYRRVGAKYTMFDPDFNLEMQLANLEDIAAGAVGDINCIITRPIDGDMMGPPAEMLLAKGIPIISWDIEVNTDEFVPFIHHAFDSENGGEALGGPFIDVVERTGKPMTILEVWGDRGSPTGQARHNGFRWFIDQHPLITVVESADTGWTDAGMGNAVIDTFTAHPEYSGLFIPGGGQSGPIEALRTIGRLTPIGDPGHVTSVFIDCDFIANEHVDKGLVDAVSSHGTRDMLGLGLAMSLVLTVMGDLVPAEVQIPMVAITPENQNTATVMKGIAAWPLLGWNADIIYVLDSTELGVPIPTLADRMEKLGY